MYKKSINKDMSILNRLGWANREIINEGLLHTDGLKQRIANLFKRTSLGNSPTYVVGRIANALREEIGEDYDINDVTDEDIIRIANSESITRNKFIPELKDGIANSRQEDEGEMSDVMDSGLPSDSYEDDDDFEDFFDDEIDLDQDFDSFDDTKPSTIIIRTAPIISDDDDDLEMEFSGEPSNHDGCNDCEEDEEYNEEDEEYNEEEDAEEVKTSGCETKQSPYYAGYAKNNIKKVYHPTEITKENVKLSKEKVNQLLQENYRKSLQHKFKQEQKYRR
jgi:DNA-directed RNA polymerase subunit delta